MSFNPILADIRFGCGRSPNIAGAQGSDSILRGLTEADTMAERFPVEPTEIFLTRLQERIDLGKIRRANRGSDEAKAAIKAMRRLNRTARLDHLTWMSSHILRRVYSPTPFRERIEAFWADHFTTVGKQGIFRRGTSPFVESGIRPLLAGRFEDLLVSAVTHPMMVHYLDQDKSTGPNSIRSERSGGQRGLNENLAREILELHTLGVDGPYTQTDVRELAELLTGLTIDYRRGRKFRKDMAEPGPETILDVTYGGGEAHIRDIDAALRDLARHPVTARHIAGKLAVHFVSDQPDPDLVAHIEKAWLDSDGDLIEIYRALLDHPSSWDTTQPNVKQPFDFITSALRALAIDPEALFSLEEPAFRFRIHEPLRLMGHIWQKADGPDGLDEDDSAWITPQSMAARLQWAVAIPQLLQPALPDPRLFVETALGPNAPEVVRFAASAAESRSDGIGLVLASPAFQRM